MQRAMLSEALTKILDITRYLKRVIELKHFPLSSGFWKEGFKCVVSVMVFDPHFVHLFQARSTI